MPKDEEPYKLSATQLIELSKSREVIPCTLSSDIGLGGGIPLGCTVVIGGKMGMGKTTVAIQYAANAQQLYDCDVFFFPIEGRLTHLVLSQIQNLNTDKMQIIMPPAIVDKKTGEVIGNQKWDAAKWWAEIGNVIKSNRRAIIIVDSISSMSTEQEEAEGMGVMSRGMLQKLESQFCKLYGTMVIQNRITLFLLAQIQSNTSGYGNPIAIKAGNNVKHQADIILFGKSVQKWPEENGKIKGHDAVFLLEKSALGPPNLEISIPLRYGEGIDKIKDLVTHATNWGIIKAKGAWFYLPFNEKSTKLIEPNTEEPNEGDVKVHGSQNVRHWLVTNPKYVDILEKAVRQRVFA